MNWRINYRSTGRNLLLFAALAGLPALAFAQVPVDEDGNPIAAVVQDDSGYDGDFDDAGLDLSGAGLDAAALEELVGPVALYPDDLLAIVLPASTYPLEIVQAARFLERLENDSSLEPDEDWDESVVALLNYPEVIRMMDEDIDWTWKLGEAVISQQNDVIAAVESFRDRAYAAGNLKSDEYQNVSYDEGTIEIAPVSEEIIYVPYYEPAQVIVRQPRRVYYYYPDPYPVYYYPYPVGYRFRHGYFWGVTTAFSIGWSNHYLHVYHPTYWGHPYYGHSYYGHYYRRPSINIYNTYYVQNSYRRSVNRYRDGDYWRPRYRSGARQDEPRVRNYHRPPDRRDAGSRGSIPRVDRDRAIARNNGRMDLNLRDRGRDGVNRRNRDGSTVDTRRSASGDRTSVRRNDNAATDRRAADNRIAARAGNYGGNREPGNRNNRSADNRGDRLSTNRRSGNRSGSERTSSSRRDRGDGNAFTFRSRDDGNSERSRRSVDTGTNALRQRQQVPSAPARREAARTIERRAESTARRPAFASQPNSSRSAGNVKPRATTRRSESRAPAPRATSRAPAPRVERQSRGSARQSAPAPRASGGSEKRAASRSESKSTRSSRRNRNRD